MRLLGVWDCFGRSGVSVNCVYCIGFVGGIFKDVFCERYYILILSVV